MIPDNLWTDEEIDDAAAWVEGVFNPRTIALNEINENNKIFMRGAFDLGIPYKRYVLNTYEPNESPHEVYSNKSSFELLLRYCSQYLRIHNSKQ